jgi:tetratricopeptide (TPR) repeat protein
VKRSCLPRSVLALVVMVLASCGGGPPSRFTGEANLQGGSAESAVARFERERDRAPDDFAARLKLASLYYLNARDALTAGDEETYRSELARAQTEILEATRLDPTSPQTHALMGVIRIYQGDLNSAEVCFKNAMKLNLRLPDQLRQAEGVHYSNLAHLSVYQGKTKLARGYVERARKLGAPAIELDRIELLAAWRDKDLIGANDIFRGAVDEVPGFADTWDDAPLPMKMTTFYNFAEVCCSNPTCGPHMADACAQTRKRVQYRQVRIETEREEQRLEQDRRLKIEAIYETRKDLEITTEELSPPPAPAPSTPPPAPSNPAP